MFHAALAEPRTTSEKYEAQNVLLQNTVQQQQRYLESIDFDRRKNNMIITGVAEDAPPPPQRRNQPGNQSRQT